MVKYTIEGNINFYEELYKSFDDLDDTITELCQITGMPLIDRFVILECNHKFNYNAIYKEIYKQKIIFRSYNYETLISSELAKFKESKKDYFIKCPYCRSIQFTLLPYYEDMEHEKRYGINSLEKGLVDSNYVINSSPYNYTYTAYGYTFNSGSCCKVINTIDSKEIYCSSKMSAPVLEMNKSFCSGHIRGEVKKYNLEKIIKEKLELKNTKIKEKEELMNAKIKAKEELMNAKIKAKEELINAKIKAKENKLKKFIKVQNIVTNQEMQITTFIPDTDIVVPIEGCKAILKSGLKKGQPCGNKVQNDGCCSRHKVNIL
jgi:hypothetical protein